MSNLFSDAVPAPAVPHRAPALECSVTVPAPPDHAFAGFTEQIHLWWPSADLSVWGVGTFFDLEDNALVETSPDNDEAVWAEVHDRMQDSRLEMSWYHQPDGGVPTDVRIGFTAGSDGGTLVALVHDGWSTEPASVQDRAVYQMFWPLALEKFQRFMGGTQ